MLFSSIFYVSGAAIDVAEKSQATSFTYLIYVIVIAIISSSLLYACFIILSSIKARMRS